MLLSLGLLPITMALIAVNFISSLLSLTVWMWTKLRMLFKHTVTQALSVQYIVCRLADVQKSIASMFSKSQNFAWSEVGASRQDYTSASLETPGEPKQDPKQEQLERAMKHPIDVDRLRKLGM
jgi:hypothetical protein